MEAAFYCRTTSDNIQAANLRNAQAMANVLGQPVAASDGSVVYPQPKPTPVDDHFA